MSAVVLTRMLIAIRLQRKQPELRSWMRAWGVWGSAGLHAS